MVYKEQLSPSEAATLAAAYSSVHVKEIASDILQTDPAMRPSLGVSLGMGLFQNELEICQNSNLPIAIFHGANDSMVNKSYLDGLQIPGLWKNKVQHLSNSGHSPQVEDPRQFNERLNEFVKSI